MGKTNLLTLFITVIVVVVAAELLVNDYTSGEDLQKKMDASVDTVAPAGTDPDMTGETTLLNFASESLAPKSTADLSASVINAEPAPGEAVVAEGPKKDGKVIEETDKAVITFALIGRVGFHNIVLQRVPFNGIMFEKVDMRDFASVPIIRQNLLQNNREQVAEFYEMHSESQLLANEIYLLIREKALTAIEAGVNETNDFGSGSFYINYSNRPDNAFLIVKVRESVYAFVYKKELHSFIKSLIPLL